MNRQKRPPFALQGAPAFGLRVRSAGTLAVVLALGAGRSSAALGDVPEQHSSTTELLSTSRDLGRADSSSIRRLGLDIRVETTRRLVGLAQNDVVRRSAVAKLELVRALALHEREAHSRGQPRDQVVRALISLLHPDTFIEPEATREAPEAAGLDHLVRGSAAMALVQSEHLEGLRALAGLAIGGSSNDPSSAVLARGALRTLSATEVAKFQLAPLIDVQALLHALWAADPAIDLPEDPQALVALGASFGAKPGINTQTKSVTFGGALASLVKRGELPPAFAQVRGWKKAMAQDPVWTFRAFFLLSSVLPHEVQRWVQKQANRAQETGTPLTQEAAQQIVLGTRPKNRSSDDKQDIDESNPRTWSMFSTSELWRRQATENTPAVVALLASRLRAGEPGHGPDVRTVQEWLSSENSGLRAAAARGLGHAKGESASGLLVRAYRTESDPVVRRALAASLKFRGLTNLREVADLLRLDPDEGCRSRVEGRRDSDARGFFIAMAGGKKVTVTDREGREIVATPDSDGFVALVGDTL